jgi:hypothetical protein
LKERPGLRNPAAATLRHGGGTRNGCRPAVPIATLGIEAWERHERRERTHRDD